MLSYIKFICLVLCLYLVLIFDWRPGAYSVIKIYMHMVKPLKIYWVYKNVFLKNTFFFWRAFYLSITSCTSFSIFFFTSSAAISHDYFADHVDPSRGPATGIPAFLFSSKPHYCLPPLSLLLVITLFYLQAFKLRTLSVAILSLILLHHLLKKCWVFLFSV